MYGFAAPHILEHALDLRGQVFHSRRSEDLHLGRNLGDFDFDFLVVEFALAQALAKFLSGAGVVPRFAGRESNFARWRKQHVQNPLFCKILGPVSDLERFLFAHLLDRHLDKVANDRINILTNVADFGELGRFNLDERRISEAGEAPRDFGLADAGRAYHEDVLRRDLVAQGLGDFAAAPAIAKGDCDSALGRVLSDDVLVQFVDDFPGGHIRHVGA